MRRTASFILSASIAAASLGLLASPAHAVQESERVFAFSSDLDRLAYEMVALSTARVWSAAQCNVTLPEYPATQEEIAQMAEAFAKRSTTGLTAERLQVLAEKELQSSTSHLNMFVGSFQGCRKILKRLHKAHEESRATYLHKAGDEADVLFKKVSME